MSPHRRPVPLWYALLAVVVSMAALAGAGIVYTEHVARRQCAVLVAEVEVYRESPPTTDTGRRIAAAKEGLLRDLRC